MELQALKGLYRGRAVKLLYAVQEGKKYWTTMLTQNKLGTIVTFPCILETREMRMNFDIHFSILIGIYRAVLLS